MERFSKDVQAILVQPFRPQEQVVQQRRLAAIALSNDYTSDGSLWKEIVITPGWGRFIVGNVFNVHLSK